MTKKKGISTQSAKAKGRKLQQWVVKQLLEYDPDLQPDDVTSRSMGANGEDILLSPDARKTYPISVECKARKRFSLYTEYDQAKANCPVANKPVLIIKGDRKQPLAVVDAEYFIECLSYIRELEERL